MSNSFNETIHTIQWRDTAAKNTTMGITMFGDTERYQIALEGIVDRMASISLIV